MAVAIQLGQLGFFHRSSDINNKNQLTVKFQRDCLKLKVNHYLNLSATLFIQILKMNVLHALVVLFALSESLEFNILHINDHHGHLDEETFKLDATTKVEEVEVTYGGFPLIVSLFDRLVASEINPIKLHAGDALTGTQYYTLFKGKADAKMMHHICFDAFEVGNHEFDDGDDVLSKFIDDVQSSSTCGKTPILGANIKPGLNSPLKGKILPYTVVTLQSGEKIGIVGIDVKGKTMRSSNPTNGTILTDEVESAQLAIDELESLTPPITTIMYFLNFIYKLFHNFEESTLLLVVTLTLC
eukprot:GSMAST32.ASY1.ANO1.1417.1 assembled CDS